MLSMLAILSFSIAAIFGCLTFKYFLESLRSPPPLHAFANMIAFQKGLTDGIVQPSGDKQ